MLPSRSESGLKLPVVSAESAFETPAVVLAVFACSWSLAPLFTTVSPLAPAGRAMLLPVKTTVPPFAANVRAPVKVLLPHSSKVPAPALVKPLPPIGPPMVSVLAETVMVLEIGIETGPVPRFRLFVPAKAKSPDTWMALLAASVRAPATASSVPPESVTSPLPKPASWPRLSQPDASKVPPE